MIIGSLYNTPIRLEEGELIAFEIDTKKNKKIKLWIRCGENLYASCETMSELDLEGKIYVNSAGYYSRDKGILPDLIWKTYCPSEK